MDRRLPLADLLVDNEVGLRVYPILPHLNRAHATIRSWVAVKSDINVNLVILSVPATVFLLKHYYEDLDVGDEDLEEFLQDSFQRDNLPGRMTFSEFEGLLRQTPFRKYRSTTKALGGANFDNYVITTHQYWTEVLAQIEEEFEETQDPEFPVEMWNAGIPRDVMIQRTCTI